MSLCRSPCTSGFAQSVHRQLSHTNMRPHLTGALLGVLCTTVYCSWAPIRGAFTTQNNYKPRWPIYSIGKGEVFIDNTGNDTSINEVSGELFAPPRYEMTSEVVDETQPPDSSTMPSSTSSNTSLNSYLSMMAPILSNTSSSNFTMLSYLPVMSPFWSKIDTFNASSPSSDASYFPAVSPGGANATTPNTTLTYTTTERSVSGWKPIVPLPHQKRPHWKPIVPVMSWTTMTTTDPTTTLPPPTTATTTPATTVPPPAATTAPTTSVPPPPSTSSSQSTSNQTATSSPVVPGISTTATATATISTSPTSTIVSTSSTTTTATSKSPQPLNPPESLFHNLRALLQPPSSTPLTLSVVPTPSSIEISDTMPTRSTPRSIQSTTRSEVSTTPLVSRTSVAAQSRAPSVQPHSISVDFSERIALHSNNCTRLFTINKGGELFFSFNLAANLLNPCKMSFRAPPGEKIALQLTEISLAERIDRALGDHKGGCNKDAISVFSHPEGILFMTDQLCDKEQSSSLLVTDTQSPVVTLSYSNTAAGDNDTSANFNLHVFTYNEDNATLPHV